MSLINQMLKDIDKRQGVNATTFSDTAGIRLEATRSRHRRPNGCGSGVVWPWWWQGVLMPFANGPPLCLRRQPRLRLP